VCVFHCEEFTAAAQQTIVPSVCARSFLLTLPLRKIPLLGGKLGELEGVVCSVIIAPRFFFRVCCSSEAPLRGCW
jgi:hypothetical protein